MIWEAGRRDWLAAELWREGGGWREEGGRRFFFSFLVFFNVFLALMNKEMM